MPASLSLMELHEATWLAGILEGEGCFYDHYKARPQTAIRPAVRLAMCDEDVVDRASKLMNCSCIFYHPPSHRSTGRRPQYVACATGAPAESVMRAVLPHMGKRRAAKILQLLGEEPTP